MAKRRPSAAPRSIVQFQNAIALTIGGSDCSGGAGIQADLKTFQQVGAFGTSVITLVTAQNTLGVQALQVLDESIVLSQLESVIADLPPRAAKTGALGTKSMIKSIAKRASDFAFPLVVDPVMISKNGDSLLPDDALDTLRDQLIPHAYLLTPNRFETEKLTGTKLKIHDEDSVAKAIYDLQEMGADNVLLKLGRVSDKYLCVLGTPEENRGFYVPYLDSRNTHGTGCALSAAITAHLAIGIKLLPAVEESINSVAQAMIAGQALGAGHRPIEFRMIAQAQTRSLAN